MASKMFVNIKNNSNPSLNGEWEVLGTLAGSGDRKYVEILREDGTKNLLWVPAADLFTKKVSEPVVEETPVEEEAPAEETPAEESEETPE